MHHRYITVVTSSSQEQIEAYLYDHTKIVSSVIIASNHRRHFLLETTADTEDRASFLANYQSERLQSGLHGAAVYETAELAVAKHAEEWGEGATLSLPIKTRRVLVAVDLPVEQTTDDPADVLASIHARLADEAGYLDSGEVLTPTQVVVAFVDDTTEISPLDLRGIYEVGVEGVQG